jgi:polyphosphate kinase
MSITSILWEEISNSFIKIKEAHNNQTKRAIKSQIPKQQSVREEIVNNLVKYFNKFVNAANTYWRRLTPDHKEWVNKHFDKLRDRTILAFTNLEIKYVAPNSSIVSIDINILQTTDSDSESDTQTNIKMPLTTSEFFNLAANLVPKLFNGDVSGLIYFIDAITLLKENCEGQEENAVNFVKTRLIGEG